MKILILHSSLGEGHKIIAQNLGAALSKEHDVEIRDIFDIERGRLLDWSNAVYLRIIESFPWVWKFFYTNKIFLKITLPFRRVVAGWRSKRLETILSQNAYDAVLSTQVTASSIVSYLKMKHKFFGKFIVAFSDYHFHPYWAFDNVDLYLTNIAEQKEALLKLGFPPAKIAVCGMTLQPKQKYDETEVRNKFGVKPGEKVILSLNGSKGMRINTSKIEEVGDLDAKIFVVCGKNPYAQRKLAARYADKKNITVLGYVSPLAELYSIADIVLSKPGGLTVAECLEYGLPILVTSILPGQEDLNVEWLSYHNLIFPEFLDLKGAVEDEIATHNFREDLRRNPDLTLVVQHGEEALEAVRKLFEKTGKINEIAVDPAALI